MIMAANVIKRADPLAKTIFIGPCLAKKNEFKLDKTNNAIDLSISFEELNA
jgi:iron only hydrogenase large subunit-like protein